MERFEIIWMEPVESLRDPPAEACEQDEEDLELYLMRYFHENNRRIVIRVGSEEVECELDPEIAMTVMALPRIVRRLEEGTRTTLPITERHADIYLAPDGERTLCTPHRWGRENEPSFTCDRAQVIGELRRFTEEIARDAVAGGYLTPEQAKSFLAAS
jgi:hypothetical protein